ncbi:interleukin 17a/f2 [Boleophthalmus pectinirostris]|uniref:interleukin 17a/f2 n=1 Tax=Boleophthalmus pectinirostris TaxID=150288 RepID=UPI000A1C68CA|nr:interleukin 17a/f2 [Boleophthalmus pectinirostris]
MRNLNILLVCCSVWWAGAARRRGCDTKLDLSTNSPRLSQAMGESTYDIHSRSLSPWTWKASTVSTRIPSTLWEAECNSSVCWLPHRNQETEGVDMGLSAVPIYQVVLVLEKKQGSRCFTTAFHPLAVGCTCVRAPTTTT